MIEAGASLIVDPVYISLNAPIYKIVQGLLIHSPVIHPFPAQKFMLINFYCQKENYMILIPKAVLSEYSA
jgi:hypothetical protein